MQTILTAGGPGARRSRAGRSAMRAWRRARRRALVQAAATAVVIGLVARALAGVVSGPDVADPAGVVALLFVALVAGPWWVRRADAGRWARGAAGEVATAALLAAGLGRRAVVFHDLAVPVAASKANIDHVVICRSGCWVVDTKTTRARLQARWRRVQAGERTIDTGPVAWEADALAAALVAAGVDWAPRAVRPIVAVHGEGLGRRGRRVSGVPVVPASAVVGRIRRRWRSARLTRADIRSLADACTAVLGPAAGGRK